MMTPLEKQLNGIPWEFCVLIAVAMKNPEKLSDWEALTPDVDRDKQLWRTWGFVDTPLDVLESYLKSRSEPLSKCDSCGHPQCGNVPRPLWHTLKTGKLFDYGPEGFEFKFVCEWCTEKFFAARSSNCPIGFWSSPLAFSQLGDTKPRVVIQ